MYRSQFRLPYELYEKLKESADQNNRSLNAEIVDRLQSSLREPDEQFRLRLTPETRQELLDELIAELAERQLLKKQREPDPGDEA